MISYPPNKYSDYKIFNYGDKIQSLRLKATTGPLYVRIKPFNACNHDCFFCVYSQSNRKTNSGDKDLIPHEHAGMHTDIDLSESLPGDRYLALPSELHEAGVKAITLSGGGEPLMHPQTVEVLDRFNALGIKTSCITNGQLLNGDIAKVLSQASWVRVSIDYSTSEEMARSRNVPPSFFDKVLSNIDEFAKLKSKNTDLYVNYIVHKHNISDLPGISKKLKEAGVMNLRFSPMWTPDFVEYHSSIAEEVSKQLEHIRNELCSDSFSMNSTYVVDASQHSSERSYTRCCVMETIPVIGADQNVYACHNKAFDNTGLIGSIRDQSFSDLWFSDSTRKYFDGFNPMESCQHQCSNDKKNIIMNDFLSSSSDPFI